MKTDKMIDLGVEEKYPSALVEDLQEEDTKKRISYPRFTVRDKSELLDTPEEFEAMVRLKVSAKEQREAYDDEDDKSVYVEFKVLELKPLKKVSKKKMAMPSDFELKFDDLDEEDED
jgi:hypothetical protein